MRDITVLITAAGGLGYPSLIKSLRRIRERKIRIIGVASDRDALGFAFIDKGYVIPRGGKRGFIPAMIKICKEEKVDAVISTAPWELKSLSKNIDKFRRVGTAVSISPLQGLHKTMNKYSLMKHCLGIGVPVPEFRRVNDLNSFREAVRGLGYPELEVCFKPVASAGSRGFRILSAKRDRLALLMEHEGGSAVSILDEILPVFKTAEKFPEMLVMEYLPNTEYSVDALAVDGKALTVIPRIRTKVAIGASISGETVRHEGIIGYSEKLIHSLKLNGVVGLQFKEDLNGTPKLIEINPRPHGAVPFSIAAGANLIYLTIKAVLGEKIKKPRVHWGMKIHRYFAEI